MQTFTANNTHQLYLDWDTGLGTLSPLAIFNEKKWVSCPNSGVTKHVSENHIFN